MCVCCFILSSLDYGALSLSSIRRHSLRGVACVVCHVVSRLDGALTALDAHEAEITHCLWEDFLLLLGRAMGGAVYEEGTCHAVLTYSDQNM